MIGSLDWPEYNYFGFGFITLNWKKKWLVYSRSRYMFEGWAPMWYHWMHQHTFEMWRWNTLQGSLGWTALYRWVQPFRLTWLQRAHLHVLTIYEAMNKCLSRCMAHPNRFRRFLDGTRTTLKIKRFIVDVVFPVGIFVCPDLLVSMRWH